MVVSTNASALVLAGGPNATAIAGAPVTVELEAVDVLQDRVLGYQGNVEIDLTSSDGPTWVNASASGPALRSNGLFELYGNSWKYGYLNLTVTVAVSGVVNLSVLPMGGPTGPAPLRIVVLPDVADERLTHPDTVRSGERQNATLYEIRDRFGNPIPGGWVLVRSIFGGLVTNVSSPIRVETAGSFVWVNFSAPSSGGGVVYVLSQSGEALLPPIAVPALPALPAKPVELELAVGAAAATIAALGLAVALLRRRRTGSTGADPPNDGAALEDGLKRLAEGRAHVVEHVPFDTPVDLDRIALGWSGPPPDAAELAEWVGSLVAEGALRASIGPGRSPDVRAGPPDGIGPFPARRGRLDGPRRRPRARPLRVDPSRDRRRLGRPRPDGSAGRGVPADEVVVSVGGLAGAEAGTRARCARA